MARRVGQTGRFDVQACATVIDHGPECNCNYTLRRRIGPSKWEVEMKDGTTRTVKFVSRAEYDRHF